MPEAGVIIATSNQYYTECLIPAKHIFIPLLQICFAANKTVAGSVSTLCNPPYALTDKPVEV